MTTDNEKLFDRIMKLHRKAESAKQIGSEAEAMIFAEAVQKLLIKHELELTDVELALHHKEQPIKAHLLDMQALGLGKRKNVMWYEVMASATVKAHLCEMMPMYKSNNLLLVGRRENRKVAEFMVVTLTRLAEELADKAYTKHFYQCMAEGDVTKARGFRASFLVGFSARVATRYKEMIKARQVEHQHNPHALIRLSTETGLVKEVLNELAGQMGTVMNKASRPSEVHEAGFMAGHEAGGQVNLSANAVAGKEEDVRRMTAGQKLIGGGA